MSGSRGLNLWQVDRKVDVVRNILAAQENFHIAQPLFEHEGKGLPRVFKNGRFRSVLGPLVRMLEILPGLGVPQENAHGFLLFNDLVVWSNLGQPTGLWAARLEMGQLPNQRRGKSVALVGIRIPQPGRERRLPHSQA